MAGKLQLGLAYSEKIFQHTTIERFGESLHRALQALIAHCRSPEAGGFTPSDFPLATLTQPELDLITGSDKRIEDIYPLSPFQQGLLFHRLYAPESDVYFTQLSGTIDQQQLDVETLSAHATRGRRHPVPENRFIGRESVAFAEGSQKSGAAWHWIARPLGFGPACAVGRFPKADQKCGLTLQRAANALHPGRLGEDTTVRLELPSRVLEAGL